MIPHDLRSLARALGGEVVCGREVLAPGPGLGPRNRSMSVSLSATSPLGFIAHSFRGQSWPELRAHICDRLGISPDVRGRPLASPLPRATRAPAPASPAQDDDERIGLALDLFRESVDPIGTSAERYFASRGLDICDLAGRVVRWCPRINGVICLFRNVVSGAPQAVTRIYLDINGRKVGRKFLGPVGGAAVMLDGFDAVTGGLHIAEGVETAQAARQLGLTPTWALGSAGAVAAFPVLAGVETLTLLGEHDDASARAVAACAERWAAAGAEVFINRPIGGKDLNDVIGGHAA